MKRIILVLLLSVSARSLAQTKKSSRPAKPADLNSPAWKEYDAKMNILRTQAQNILSDEYAREKKEECPNLQSEAEIRECMAGETRLTQKNYDAYTKTLIALLRVRQPVDDPMELVPPDRGAKSKLAERAWVSYRNITCSAMSDSFFGGTMEEQIETGCLQDLTRRHMHELESLYKDE